MEQHCPEIRVNTDFLFQELLRTKFASDEHAIAHNDVRSFIGGFDVSLEFIQFITETLTNYTEIDHDTVKRIWAWPHHNTPLQWRSLDIKDVVPVPQIQYLMNQAHPQTRFELVNNKLCLSLAGLRHAIWTYAGALLADTLELPDLCENGGAEHIVMAKTANCEPDRLRLFIDAANDEWPAYGTWMPTRFQHALSLTMARCSVCVILSIESPFLVHLMQHFDQQFGTTVASVIGSSLHIKVANVLR
jgi:hypothetical protein